MGPPGVTLLSSKGVSGSRGSSCRETGNLAKDSGHIREQDQFGKRVHNGDMLRGRAIVDQ